MKEKQPVKAGALLRRLFTKANAAMLAATLVMALLLEAYQIYNPVSQVFTTGDAGELTQETDPNIEANGERFYNLLLVGLDYDENAADGLHNYEDGKAMSDVIMYVQVDRDTGSVNILQIPRDSYAGETFSDGTTLPTGKINSAYGYGPDQDNMINNLANKMYELFKLPVDNYVTIDMASFKTLLNVMGGITMYVPWDIVDKDTGEVLVTQGTHAVSGDTAEVILRNRNYTTADFQRLETQQYFYAALVHTFLEEYTLADYYTACKNIAVYINTDLDISELWGLYATMTSIDASNIFVIRLPGGSVSINGHSDVYGVDRDLTAELLNTYFRDHDMPVDAEDLGLYPEFDYSQYGEVIDEGRYLGTLENGAEGDPNDILHQQLKEQQAAEAASEAAE